MAKKDKWPTILYVIKDSEGTPLCDDSYAGMEHGDEVAIYELVKTASVSRTAELVSICDVPRYQTTPRSRRVGRRSSR